MGVGAGSTGLKAVVNGDNTLAHVAAVSIAGNATAELILWVLQPVLDHFHYPPPPEVAFGLACTFLASWLGQRFGA